MNRDIALGMELQKLSERYFFKDLAAFVKGEPTETGALYFQELKPLYDKYGYKTVNSYISEISDKMGTGVSRETRPKTEKAEEIR